MKIPATLFALAVVATQAAAITPTPIEGCQKLAMVLHSDTGCDQFAHKHNTTFANLLKWNARLSPKCDNMDTDHNLCVLGPKEMPTHP
ncbi:hypothetical protein BGZ98_000389, partial [Dissophora globulifera]